MIYIPNVYLMNTFMNTNYTKSRDQHTSTKTGISTICRKLWDESWYTVCIYNITVCWHTNIRLIKNSLIEECTTFAPATIAPMINNNVKCNPILTLTLTLIVILILILPQTKNPIVVLTLTLCCQRYRRSHCRWNKYLTTLKDLSTANACWLVLIYNTLIITNVAKRLLKYVPYSLL